MLDIYSYHDNGVEKKEEPIESVLFPERIARNAGIPFEIKGRQFRPAQNCAKRYGECVIIQEIIKSENGIQFNEVNRFYSPLPSHRVAFHTFNVFEDKYIAVDAEGMRYGLLARILISIRECFRK